MTVAAGRFASRAGRTLFGACLLLALILATGATTAAALAPPGTTRSLSAGPAPNPIAVDHYLASQRSGFGSPARAATLAARAEARAQLLRAQTARRGAARNGTVNAPATLTGPWEALGPTPVTGSFYGSTNTGRVDSLAVVSSGPNKGEIFEGTAGGGVWSSTDGGKTWQSHTDQESTGLAIGALAIDPSSLNNAGGVTIYAGTGEANGCGDCFYGGGVLKSTDGGNTWAVENPAGIFTGVDFTSLAVDPNNSSDVWAGTTAGLYESTDGGASWAQPAGDTSPNAAYGLVLDPTTPTTTVYIGTTGVGLQKSTDGGGNFTTLGAGTLPAAADFGILALGIGTRSASFPTADATLYAAVQLDGGALDSNGGDLSMYKSTDGGTSWTKLTIPAYTTGTYAYGSGQDQASYDTAIAVDPTNPSDVLAAGIAIVQSTDGGSGWTNVNGQSFFGGGTNVIHPDFHALTFASGTEALIGCDGGVYAYNNPVTGVSPTGSTGITSLNTNQNTTQFYENLSVYNNGAQILGGLQDNGTVLFTGSAGWPDTNSGDGGDNAINPNDSQQQFGEADASLYRTSDAWQTTETNITPSGAGGEFVPPIALVPNSVSHDAPTLFFGGNDLYVTTNAGTVTKSSGWTKVTAVGAGVTAIAVAPSNSSDVYVGFTNGTVEVSSDGGSTFNSISPTGADPGTGDYVTHIDVNPTSPTSITLTYSAANFPQSSSTPPVVATGAVTLGGTPSATYTDITGNLPTGVAANSVVTDGAALVVATDVGVFSTTAPNGAATQWSAVGTGLPNVQVLGLSVDAQGDLFAATHGRGAWELPASALSSPAVTSLGKTSAPAGASVTITGSNFAGVSAVDFGGTAASSFTVNSVDQITATAPSGAGTVDVTVTTPSGTSGTVPQDLFTYSAPAITNVSPGSGPPSGGTSVTITGTNLSGATAVKFGATAAATFTVNSDTQITATSPAGSGTVDVTVTTPSGTSATSASDHFAYQPPALTGISPSSGPASGGTSVTITGTNLSGATAVKFGATAAATFTVNSDTQITATSPAGSGTVDVTVTTPSGTSATSAGDHFTYVPPTPTTTTTTGTTSTPTTTTGTTSAPTTTTTTTTTTPTPTPPPHVALQKPHVSGTKVTVGVSCSTKPASCVIKLRLTITEHVKKHIHHGHKTITKTVTKTVTIGSATRTLATGGGSVSITLNKTGKRLLKQLGTLHASLLVSSGSGPTSKRSLTIKRTHGHRKHGKRARHGRT